MSWLTAILQMTALAVGMFTFGWGIALSNQEGSNRDGALWVIGGGSLVTAVAVVLL